MAGAEGGGAVNVGNDAGVSVPAYAGPGPFSQDPTQADPALVEPSTNAKSLGNNSATSGKKRERELPAIREVVEVSRVALSVS